MTTIQRIFKGPRQSYFLFGPRGTGKTTWLESTYQNALRLDLLKPQTVRTYLARPERLSELVEANPNQKVVVIDEVQKAPDLLPVVHSLMEAKKDLQFILTGSSSRKLKRVQANLLGGRARYRAMHPFIGSELLEQFDLQKSLKNGLLPVIFFEANPSDALEGYVHLYLKEEVQAEALVRQLEHFTRFLEVMSFSHASLLNVTNVARECEIKRKTVENYIEILKDLLLGFTVPQFTIRAARELTHHPKFYLFDAGVFQTIRPKGVLDSPSEIEGAALEGLVAQHLRAWCDYSDQKHSLYFWRTPLGVEVDFIVYGSQGLWAFEVKNSKNVYRSDLKSLRIFLKDYPEAKAACLYRGEERLLVDNILCLPCEAFLRHLRPDQVLF